MKKIRTAAAKKIKKNASQKLTIGLDLGDRWSWYCVLDEAGEAVPLPLHPAELLYRRHRQRSQVPSRSTSKQPRVNANGNGPGSLVRYDPSKKTSVRSPISSLN
jgi:hypothetical protein